MKLRFNAQVLFAGFILLGFFLPWASMGILNAAGFQIPFIISRLANEFARGGDKAIVAAYYLLYLFPLISLIIIFLNLSNKKTNIASIILGVLPLILLAYLIKEYGEKTFAAMSVGGYLTIAGALLLLLAGLGIIKFGEATGGEGAGPSIFSQYKKQIIIGSGGLVAATLLFIGGRALYRVITAPPESLVVEKMTASSVLASSANYTFLADNANDGRLSTAWGEGVKGDGIGESITASFAEPVSIKEISICNGLTDTHASLGNLYPLNNRVKAAKIIFDDGEETVSLKDNTEDQQTVKLKSTHKSKSAKIVITEVYKGSKWDDTLISEVSFYGRK